MADRILVAEDEKSISLVLQAYLKKAGYDVMLVHRGDQVMHCFDSWKPSLVLLDVMLPGMDGWSILKAIRAQSACPIIMLTALNDVVLKVDGLNEGADDYISKPFMGEEVVARVRAVLRRQNQVQSQDVAVFGMLRIDHMTHEVRLRGMPVHLPPRELALLLFLARHPNQVFSREQLIEHVWGFDYTGSDRAVDLAVRRIRQALAAWPKEEGSLATLTKVGYQFRVQG